MQTTQFNTRFYIEYYKDNQLFRLPSEFLEFEDAKNTLLSSRIKNARIVRIVQKIEILQTIVYPEGIECY